MAGRPGPGRHPPQVAGAHRVAGIDHRPAQFPSVPGAEMRLRHCRPAVEWLVRIAEDRVDGRKLQLSCAPHNYHGHLSTAISAVSVRGAEHQSDGGGHDSAPGATLFTTKVQFEDGEIVIPDGPGWGMDVNEGSAPLPSDMSRLGGRRIFSLDDFGAAAAICPIRYSPTSAAALRARSRCATTVRPSTPTRPARSGGRRPTVAGRHAVRRDLRLALRRGADGAGSGHRLSRATSPSRAPVPPLIFPSSSPAHR